MSSRRSGAASITTATPNPTPWPDAKTGIPVPAFGKNGTVDLKLEADQDGGAERRELEDAVARAEPDWLAAGKYAICFFCDADILKQQGLPVDLLPHPFAPLPVGRKRRLRDHDQRRHSLCRLSRERDHLGRDRPADYRGDLAHDLDDGGAAGDQARARVPIA